MAKKKAKSSVGTGGMFSKLHAAERALKSGITTHLLRGDIPNNLIDIARGIPVGTQIGGKYDVK
jgi:glutamate 5-kinase